MAAWLGDRVGELRAELDQRQDQIAELRARSALVSEESLAALDAEAIGLRAELRDARVQLDRLNERVAGLEATQASGERDAAVLAAAGDGQLTAAAQAAQAGEAGAEERFARRLEQLLLQTEAERARAEAQVEELTAAADALSTQFEAQASDLRALRQLEQEAEATSVLYETFLTRLREASVQEGAHEADSRILTEAMWARQITPRPARTLATSLLLGLALGAALVLGREHLQSTFRTSEELERHVGRPVLGQIPRVPARSRADMIRYLRERPTSAAAEAVRDLRTSLLLANAEQPPQVIMTTSSVPAEGKTTVSIALAQNFAGLGKRVLLIEGDIRRRTFESYFDQRDGGGLLSVVSGEVRLAEAVIQPDGLGVDVLFGERSKVNAADLFSSAAFRQLLEEARASYDHVLIDTPPVLVVPDARVIAQVVDAVVYVVQWDRTSRTQVEEGMRQFHSVHVPITGLVLSRVDPKGMRRYGYGGRYGAYASYGQAYYGR
jgi:capsular exopolysaccharide synthesis family protein